MNELCLDSYCDESNLIIPVYSEEECDTQSMDTSDIKI